MGIRTNFAAQSLVDEEIDAEIKRHEKAMKTLNMRRNTYCAINQLPDDVLVSIFYAVQLQTCSSGPFRQVVFEEWIVLLQVCQAWHDIIHNNPFLWSSINLNSTQALRMLNLSKDSPLQMSFRIPIHADEGLWTSIVDTVSQSARLQALLMDIYEPATLPRVLSLIPPDCSAPHLQRLAIQVSGSGKLHGKIWLDFPSLRELSLSQAPLPSNVHAMPKLTHLRISSQLPDHQVTTSWLLEIFSSSPNLQDVDIWELCGRLVDPTSTRVSLPSLKSLSITSYDASTLSIFDYIDTPCLKALGVGYANARAQGFAATDLSGLKTTMSGVLTLPMTIHTVELWLVNEFLLRVYGPPDRPGHLGSRSIRCTLPLVPPEDMHVLLQLCDLPLLHKASLLIVHHINPDHIGTAPLSFISSYTDIETMILDDCTPHVLESLLKSDIEEDPPNPKLKEKKTQLFIY
ncbi:hypothetical protein ONZ45_g3064 [Pleurotus djamor]|nr:hypothetical protein ONZ45_g3064 [Pleurotus djamor]